MEEVTAKKIIVFGKYGNIKIDDVYNNPYGVYIRDTPGNLIEIERKLWEHFLHHSVKDADNEKEIIRDWVEQIYKAYGKFGAFGDVMQITSLQISKAEIIYSLDFIGHFAYDKPGLAVDILPVVRTKTGKCFFVGIERKDRPGKLATIGGFKDVEGFHFSTAAETAIKECEEETDGTISISATFECLNNMRKIPIMKNVTATVKLGSGIRAIESLPAKMELLDTYQTGDEENIPELGKKRVYETTAYILLIDIDSANEYYLKSLLRAGSDAKEIRIVDITNIGNVKDLEFGMSHHARIFEDAFYFVSKIYR